jgi:hypothetical protein
MPIRPRNEDWEQAGLADETNGRVGARVKSQLVRVPAGLRLDGDRLTWDSLSQHTWARADHLLLSAFVRIARHKSRPAATLRFAKRYGVFGAAELKSDWLAREPNEVEIDGARWIVGHGEHVDFEPISVWSHILDSAIALLNIGAETHQGRAGRPEDWAAVGWTDFNPQRKDALLDARWMLSRELNWWLEVGRVRLKLNPEGGWTTGRWETEIAFGDRWNLFGALALQVTLAVAGIDLYCCTGCKLPYVRSRDERRPKPEQNNYCNECRQSGQPLRDAKARYREKGKLDGKKTKR